MDHIRLTAISSGAGEEANLKNENPETHEMYEEYGIGHL